MSGSPGSNTMLATAMMTPPVSSRLNCWRPGLEVDDAGNGQPVDGLVHGQAGQNDCCVLIFQPAFGDH